MLHKKYKKQEGVPPGDAPADACLPAGSAPRTPACLPDQPNDKNAQIAYKTRTSPTRRGNDQTTIYTTGGIIHACSAFSRLGQVKIKYHILLL